MFQSEELEEHLKTQHTIQTDVKAYAEWNMNLPENIEKLGNYRYRPDSNNLQFRNIVNTYDPFDEGGYYTGATDADIVFDGGYALNPDDYDEETFITLKKEKYQFLYSLEDCVKPFRPRSGINKVLYLPGATRQYLDSPGADIASRPRYYLSSKYDQFKYWTSYRTEENVERGIAKNPQPVTNRKYIDDAAPFVVYKEPIPANRIVVKMQTNVGSIDRGDNDVFFGDDNKTTPVIWKIQVLKEDSWVDAISFDDLSTRDDGSPIIKEDGYVEIAYGLQIPDRFKDFFTFAGVISSTSVLPTTAPFGYAYLLKTSDDDIGTYYVFDSIENQWLTFDPEYNWTLAEEFVSKNSKFIKTLVNPEHFMLGTERIYREIDVIRGIRVVVTTMNKPNSTFDLIEMSPRLAADITSRTKEFSVKKALSDLGTSSLPVGSLVASTGDINIANDDYAFLDLNVFDPEDATGSIVAEYLDGNIKFTFYEVIQNVGQYDYFVPIKTLYSEGIAQANGNFDEFSLTLRDAFFILENQPAPSLMLRNVSLSYAITVLMDYIGFSNYDFRRIDGQPDPVIPYFFVAPEQNVAEVLSQLAVASQSAMFFDEYNNLIVMLKEYLLPNAEDRPTDLVLYGQEEFDDSVEPVSLPGYVNRGNALALPNILSLSSSDKKVYNSGQIDYTKRYIQRTYGSLRQANYTDQYKNWIYLPALLWEVSATENTVSRNENAQEQSSYSLAAVPLKSSLTNEVPRVENNRIINNIIDVGENVYWVARYQGYFYANAEIIKYDAIEYSVSNQSSPVWISSAKEYQEYFLNLPFNGKMYPTGNIRIFTEPYYETIDGITKFVNGPVAKHGRGQFGTEITTHNAGLDPYWSDNANVFGCQMDAKQYLFSTNEKINYPLANTMLQNSPAGVTKTKAISSTRNGIIKNFMANVQLTEKDVESYQTVQTGTIQSSALVFTGPNFEQGELPVNYVSYINKNLSPYPVDRSRWPQYPAIYKYFGTRMRIIGKIESESNKVQTPIGASEYISLPPSSNGDQAVKISGGSGGIGIMVNPETNSGYFYEIVAITAGNAGAYIGTDGKQLVTYNIPAQGAKVVSNVATITTETDHEIIVGDTVEIEGLYDPNLYGAFTVTSVPSPRQFTFSVTTADGVDSLPGKVTRFIDAKSYIANILFYKVVSGPEEVAIPIKLWSGLTNILVDDGKFTGQYRFTGDENTTVYDLDIEYQDNGGLVPEEDFKAVNDNIPTAGMFNRPRNRTFFLYLNGKQVASVTDTNPLPQYNNIALFVRGSSKCMFENVYALGDNYSQNTQFAVTGTINPVFGDTEVNATESLRKYAMSGILQSTYLSGVSNTEEPRYRMYFEEFGTIMREAAYFNIKYDRAYPALYAKISPTFNRIKGYSVSGFRAGAYGAEFLIFNCTDKTLNLDSTTGNYLRIQGITFTQSTTHTITVDDYFNKISSLSDPVIESDLIVYNPNIQREYFDQIKLSRMKYGISEFSPIQSDYIQTEEMAEDVIGWLIEKTMKPKKNLGINIFSTPILQIGDIVTINYKKDDLDLIASEDTRFVVYNIEYNKAAGENNMTVYLSQI